MKKQTLVYKIAIGKLEIGTALITRKQELSPFGEVQWTDWTMKAIVGGKKFQDGRPRHIWSLSTLENDLRYNLTEASGVQVQVTQVRADETEI